MIQNITEEQKQLLKLTTLRDGKNAWEVVQSLADADRPRVAAGILSCVNHCYGLDRLTINWETRELRYVNRTDSGQDNDSIVVSVSGQGHRAVHTLDGVGYLRHPHEEAQWREHRLLR